jgi:DNA recombination protein RmuC
MLVAILIGIALGILLAYIFWRERITKGVLYDQKNIDCIKLESIYEAEKILTQTYKQQLDSIQEHLPQQFKHVSLELFKENAQTFMHLAEEGMKKCAAEAKEALGGQRLLLEKTLDPIKEGLKDFSEKLDCFEHNRLQTHSSLKEHLENLNQMQLRLESKTELLSRALCNTNTRGRWGEMQLRRVVETAGMIEYVDFNVQQTIHNGLLRPDMLIHLPNQRTVIVDAKTPQWDNFLTAAQNTNNETDTDKELKNCCQRIRDLIAKLGTKSYDNFLDQSADFVVLFFPGEWIFSRALQMDASLIEYACHHNVVFATPTTLIALLKAVHYGWRQNKMLEDIKEIGTLGNELYERMLTFGNYFQDLRKNLSKTVESYNQLLGSLEARVLPAAKKLNAFAKKNVAFELPSPIEENIKNSKCV